MKNNNLTLTGIYSFIQTEILKKRHKKKLALEWQQSLQDIKKNTFEID